MPRYCVIPGCQNETQPHYRICDPCISANITEEEGKAADTILNRVLAGLCQNCGETADDCQCRYVDPQSPLKITTLKALKSNPLDNPCVMGYTYFGDWRFKKGMKGKKKYELIDESAGVAVATSDDLSFLKGLKEGLEYAAGVADELENGCKGPFNIRVKGS